MSSSKFRVKVHTVPVQHIREYARATSGRQEDRLLLSIKQYTPLNAPPPESDAVTIIGAHANGFPKELYEPLWDDILDKSAGRFAIRSIWIADVAHQGDSYVLNENALGNDPSWFDHSRDLLHMINHFRDSMPEPIVAIGHSFGAAQLANLALFHPRLFTSLILLDPVLEAGHPPPEKIKGVDRPLAVASASTYRRDVWPSQEDAVATFKKNPFYQRWDSRVFDCWIQHGLRKLPTAVYPEAPSGMSTEKAVTLKTSKHQEVWTYERPNFAPKGPDGMQVFDRKKTPDLLPGPMQLYPFYRPEPLSIFYRLPYLRPPTLYILGGLSNLSTPSRQRDKVKITGVGVGGSGGLAEGRVKDVIFPKLSHLVAMESPNECAEESVEWLDRTLSEWRHDRSEFEREQAERSPRDDLVVSEEWKAQINRLPELFGVGSKPKL